jgi:hypothetical protein
MSQRNVAQLGAILSDIVACTYALATENETGNLLRVRMTQIKASIDSLMSHAEIIAMEREQ